MAECDVQPHLVESHWDKVVDALAPLLEKHVDKTTKMLKTDRTHAEVVKQ
jgi:hypothetical protein